MMCPEHNTPLHGFCKQCKTLVCSKCNHNNQKTHKTFLLENKAIELFGKLDSMLSRCQKQGQEIEKRYFILNEYKKQIETATTSALEKMKEQLKLLINELHEIYHTEEENVLQLKEENMAKIAQDTMKLDSFEQQRSRLKDTSKTLISEVNTTDFVIRSREFLSCNQLQALPQNPFLFIEEPVYRQPLNADELYPGELRIYLQENCIGHIDKMRVEPGQSEYHVQPHRQVSTERTQSVYSVSGTSINTALSEEYSNPYSQPESISIHNGSDYQDDFLERDPSVAITAAKLAELVSYTDLKKFEGSRLKGFHDIVFNRDSVWICAWNKHILKRKETVLVNTQLPDFTTVLKQKKVDLIAEQTTIIVLFGDNILYAKRDGNEIYSYHPKSKKRRRVYSSADLSIAAMCSDKHQVFILTRHQTTYIRVLDSNFREKATITNDFGNIKDCCVDMCVINPLGYIVPAQPMTHRSPSTSCFVSASDISSTVGTKSVDTDVSNITIVISFTSPRASVRAVNMRNDILWQLDCRKNKELGLDFNPCSVTSSEAGDIYFADRWTNRVRSCYSTRKPFS